MTTTTPLPVNPEEIEETTQPDQPEETEQTTPREQPGLRELTEKSEQLEESDEPEESEESETTEQSIGTDALTHVLGSGLFYQDLDSLKASKIPAPKSEEVSKNKYNASPEIIEVKVCNITDRQIL